jgi:hypothetical protein
VSRWLLEFAGATADDVAGIVRLELRETERVAWYWTYLVGVPGIEGVLVVRDHEVPLPRQGLEIRAEGLWAEIMCETPREHWTFGLESFGVRLDAPDDARRAGDEIGERLAIGLDIEWEVTAGGPPAGTVHGDVLVGRGRCEVDCAGRFYDPDAPDPEPAVGEVARTVHVPIGSAYVTWDLVRGPGEYRWSPRAPGMGAAPNAGRQ